MESNGGEKVIGLFSPIKGRIKSGKVHKIIVQMVLSFRC